MDKRLTAGLPTRWTAQAGAVAFATALAGLLGSAVAARLVSVGEPSEAAVKKRDPPAHLVCSLTLELFDDPVVLVDTGHRRGQQGSLRLGRRRSR